MTTVATPRPPTSPARSHRAGLFHAQTILNRNVASMCKINDAQQTPPSALRSLGPRD